METVFSRNQLVVAFSVVLFLVVGVVSAASFADLSLTLPQVSYLIAACVVLFFVLGFALVIRLISQQANGS